MSSASVNGTAPTAIKPTPIKSHDRIVSIDWDQTVDKIIAILGLSWHHIGNNVNRTHVVVIEKDDFENYCEKSGKLTMQSDNTDNAIDIEVPFSEFMDEHVTKEDIKDYIVSQRLASHLTWSI